VRPSCTRRWTARLAPLGCGLALAWTFAAAAMAQAPPSTPLARRVPAADLLFYAEFDGLDTHAADWKASAAHKALNETTLGVLLEDLAAQGVDLMMKGRPKNPPAGSEVVALAKLVARRGFAFAFNGTPPRFRPTIIVRGGFRPETFALLERLITSLGRGKADWKTTTRGTRKVTITGPTDYALALIDDGGDLIVCESSEVDATLALLDGKVPDATKHPIVAELARPEGDFRPAAFAFLDPKILPDLPPQAAALGLDGLKRVDFRWGFQDDALFSVFRLIAPAPRRGLLALADGATFDMASLPPIPAGLDGWAAASLSLGAVYDRLYAMAAESDPASAEQLAASRRSVDARLGTRLREDLLGKLGPKMSFYPVPGAVGAALPVGLAGIAEVADPKGFDAALGRVFEVVNAALKAPRPGPPRPAAAPQLFKLPANGDRAGYRLDLPPGSVPPGPLAGLRPVLLIGKNYLAIASTPEAAVSALDVAEGKAPRWTPTGAYVKVMERVPSGLSFLAVGDPRKSLPGLVANLPTLLVGANMALSRMDRGGRPGAGPAIPLRVDPAKLPAADALSARLFPASIALAVDAQGLRVVTRESLPSLASPAVAGIGVGLLLPATQAAREAARRSQCVNNMKQMGLAFHNAHSNNNVFPTAIVGKAGKPLLSWRVAILPYLEQQELYNKFKLDEPWDSAHNKPLLAEMPKVFACPSHPAPDPATTYYRTWIGPDSAFDEKEGRGIQGFTDGTSNTVLVVEAAEAVPWTKPEGMPVPALGAAPAVPALLGAGSTHPNGFNALFADGSVKFLKATINQIILRALISPAGGEVINADAF